MSELSIRRIVIACDAVGENRSAIEMAARFAAWWNAALHGVFVEDESLLHLSALPFARHVGPGGQVSDDFDEGTILRQFEAHADRAREALETAAREHAVGWSFNIVRGQARLATLALGDQDLLVIEAASRPFTGAFRLDSRWLADVYEAQLPVLLVRSSAARQGGVVALLQSAGPSAERVIDVAARLALASNRPLSLLAAGTDFDESQCLNRVRAVSQKVAAHCRIERLSPMGATLEALAGEGSVLAVDSDPAVNDAAALKDLVARTRADILFLR